MPRREGEGRRVALLGGEAGSGKSRLVREFAPRRRSDGALVLYGACDAVVRTPYGPFVEALDQLAAGHRPAELRAALGTARRRAHAPAPRPAARIGGLPPPVEADPDTERHRLHTAVTDLLAGVSRRRPVLLVLEDGHWADAPTLLLLRHLARAAGGARLLAARHVPRHRGRRARRRSRRRSPTCAGPTTSSGCGSPGSRATRWPSSCAAPPAATSAPSCRSSPRAIGDLTGGNAFLVCELWRALIETGASRSSAARPADPPADASSARPESVREVVSQRLSRLAPRTTDLLELAATAGPEFELDVVRRAAGARGAPSCSRALDEAVRSGMIEELPSRRLAYRFTHELVRRALYDRLTGVRRAELHLRVGEALEARRRTLGRRARRPRAPLRRRGAARRRAARRRLQRARRAGGDRGARLRRGGGAPADRARAADRRARAERARGAARARAPPATAPARRSTRCDGVRGRRRTSPASSATRELLARAAIGYEDACWRPGIADQGAVELLEEAAAALGDDSSELRVGLLGGLARALDFQGDHERGGDRPRRARSPWRGGSDDRAGLATVLVRSYWSRGDELARGDPRDADRGAWRLGEELGDTEIRAEAMAWRVPTFVALGDLGGRAARARGAARDRRADRAAVHAPRRRALRARRSRCATVASSDAEAHGAALARVEPAAHRARRVRRLRDPDVRHPPRAGPPGRARAGDPGPRRRAGRGTGRGARASSSLLAELGMEAEARRELARVAADGLDRVPRVALARLAHLPDRRLRGARRRGRRPRSSTPSSRRSRART